MAANTGTRILLWTWVGLVLHAAGQVLDLRWHATHSEFEGAVEQLEAHWLLWLGAAVTMVAALRGATLFESSRLAGYGPLVWALAAYGVVSAWHFWEHAQRRDPDLPHVLLASAQMAMLLGGISATVVHRRRRAPRGSRA